MANYYVSTVPKSNGDHEVHKVGCHMMPGAKTRIYLGEYSSCHSAVEAAKARYATSRGCAECSPECQGG